MPGHRLPALIGEGAAPVPLVPARHPAGRRPTHRSSRADMLPYYGFRAGEAVVAVLPRRAAYALGSGVADILMAAAPHRFDGLRSNLRQVMAGADERTVRRVARRNLRNLSHSWINVMAMRHRPERILGELSAEGLDNLTRALGRGRGAVIASAHFGAWETGLAMWNGLGHPLALLAEELRPRQLFDRVAGARGSLGVHVIPLDVTAIREGDAETARRAGAGAMREVFRLLRAGVPVAIAVDRDLVGGGTPMRFFGREASIPLAAVDIAIRSGAAIVPIHLLPGPHGVDATVHPEIPYDPRAPRDAEVRRVARLLLELWEGLIREHPELWHVLDPIWEPATAPGRVA